MIDSDALSLGEDVAVTPGAVVFRSEVFELIQYAPQTDKVSSAPLGVSRRLHELERHGDNKTFLLPQEPLAPVV